MVLLGYVADPTLDCLQKQSSLLHNRRIMYHVCFKGLLGVSYYSLFQSRSNYTELLSVLLSFEYHQGQRFVSMLDHPKVK